MGLVTRAADLEKERGIILALLERNLVDVAHRARYEWLYLRNPAGPAWCWVVEDERRGVPVGVASLFPRAVWLQGRRRLCGQVGDFGVDMGYRTLGPAVLLQRATLRPVEDGAVAFCYDCPPHERARASLRRLALEPWSRMVRYARPLRVDRYVGQWLKGLVGEVVARAGNAVLRMTSWRGGGRRASRIEVHEGLFGEEFSRLDAKLVAGTEVRGVRSAEILNWRFREDPLNRYTVLTARLHGELVGYAVLRPAGGSTELVDILGWSGGVLVELLEAAAMVAHSEGSQALSALASAGGALQGCLARAWFRLRSHGPSVVPYARPGSSEAVELAMAHWELTHADVLA